VRSRSGFRASRVRAVRVEARAKLNLGLAVGPRRPDGYHELATVFQSISLADTLVVRPRPNGFRLSVHDEDVAIRGRGPSAGVPSGPDNLVLRAARLFQRRVGLKGGASFQLIKRIPAGAGLGGGSSDAAATLLGLERLQEARLDPRQRQEMAEELGSDVPFVMQGGTALGFGRGERLIRTRLARPFRAVVAVPSWRISTVRAYRRIDRIKYGLTGWAAKLRSAQLLERAEVTAIRCMRLGNSFEEVLGNRKKDFESLTTRMRKAGVYQLRMTGSGSAVFGILRPRVDVTSVIARFQGSERLYGVKSTRTGLRVVVDRV
jgi:4-diphosphocytidyl-2-C-methyl-D-erythritol kinase